MRRVYAFRIATAVVRARHFSAAAASEVEPNRFSIKGLAIEGRPAYLDFQATTPMDPRVLDEMVDIY